MTPKKAIKEECKWCMNTKYYQTCYSKVCKLNDTRLSPIQRIKVHCSQCSEQPKSCTGEVHILINRTCPLHPFRLGKNPNRKGIGNRKGNARALSLWRQRLSDSQDIAIFTLCTKTHGHSTKPESFYEAKKVF